MANRASVTSALLTLSEAVRSGTVRADDRTPVTLAEVLTGATGAVDLVRALTDVRTSDMAGILPPSVGELEAPPLRPLFTGPWARPWVERDEMRAPDLGTIGVAIEPPEKTDIVAGAFTVGMRPLSPHYAGWGADFSAATLSRATPRFRDTLAELVLVALQKAIEPLLLTDLGTGATASTDLVGAVAAAQGAWGGPTVILASDQVADVWAALGPVALVAGELSVVPVNAAPGTVVVTSVGNLHVEVGPLVPLMADNPTMLGTDLGYYLAAVAWLSEPAAAYKVTLP